MNGLVWYQQPRRKKMQKRNTHTHTRTHRHTLTHAPTHSPSSGWRTPLEIDGLHPAPSFHMMHTHRASSVPAFPSCSGEVITGLTDGAQMTASQGVAITGSFSPELQALHLQWAPPGRCSTGQWGAWNGGNRSWRSGVCAAAGRQVCPACLCPRAGLCKRDLEINLHAEPSTIFSC